jgi:hypothetical protein
MGKGIFAILSKVQDIEIKEQEILASSDALNSYLSIPVNVSYRLPQPNMAVDFLSIESILLFGENQILCSDFNKNIGYSYALDSEFKIELKFLLTKEVISQIEKLRTSDLRFMIKINFLITLKNKLDLNQNKTIWSSTMVQNLNSQIDFQIPKSTWIETLMPNLGYNNIRLIEIPKTHKQLTDEYLTIKKEFDKAEDYFNKNDYNKCVAHCRNVLDALNRNLKKDKNEKPLEPSFSWLKSLSNSSYDWINKVCSATHEIASKAHHPGDHIGFTRQEAESIFLVVLGLINFIAHEKDISRC